MDSVRNKDFPSDFSLRLVALGSVAFFFAFAASIPSWRAWVREQVLGGQRVILAKAEVDFTGTGDRAIVLKIKSSDGLSVEIYFFDRPGQSPIEVKRIVLSEKRDGFFDLKGNTTNLAIMDIDHDGVLELLAPAYDDNLIPRLNIYKYSPQDRSFTRLESGSID